MPSQKCSQFLIGVLILAVLGFLVPTWTKSSPPRSIKKPTFVKKEDWYLTGTIGGKHALTLSLNREGRILTGTAQNTRNEARSLYGVTLEEGFLLLEELDGEQLAGTFEGRRLANGNIRGLWTTPDGQRWIPFYLTPATPEFTQTQNEPAGGLPE